MCRKWPDKSHCNGVSNNNTVMYSVRDPASYCPTQPGRTKLTDTAHLTRHVCLQASPDLCNIPPSSPEGKPSRVVECYQCGDCRSHLTTPRQPALLACPPGYTLHQHSKHYTLTGGLCQVSLSSPFSSYRPGVTVLYV